MIKNLLALSALLCLATGILAQQPGNMRVTGDRNYVQLRTEVSCGYDAGSVSLLSAQGDTIQDPVVYLPFGDSLQVVHNGDFLLNGDPDPSSDPGIVYLFYECAPSIDSLSIVDIAADPCRLTANTFFQADGTPVMRMDSFWVAQDGDRFGNLPIVNDSSLQIGFNNGLPLQLWLAPATFDDFALRETDGACVSVSSAEAFSVVYLNEIREDSVQTNINGSGCSGRFQLYGGLPAFDSTEFYTVTITNTLDPTQTGDIFTQGRATVGRTMEFFVPVAGSYEVAVSDAAGSSYTFTVDMSGCDAVTFSLPLQNQLPGDMFCIPVTVQNFMEVNSVSFNMTWDANVLRLDDVEDFNPNLPNFSVASSFGTTNTDMGELVMAWTDLGLENHTIADGDTLFSLCFTVVGNLGSSSPITMMPGQVAEDVVLREDSAAVDPLRLGYFFNSGQVNISNDPLFVDIQSQDVSCNAGNMGPTNDGRISIRVAQGVAPYNVTFTPPSGTPINFTLQNPGDIEVFDNLAAGDYDIQIEDSTSGTPNSFSDMVTIEEPGLFRVRVEEISDISCADFSDGVVRAELFIDNTPVLDPENYTYIWNVPGENGQIVTGLTAGTYEVTVTNANGCMESQDEVLLEPSAVTIPVANRLITQASCSGVADGEISVTAAGGTAANATYRYDWDAFGLDSIQTSVQSNVLPGTYFLTVTDDNGCTLEDSVQVRASKELIIDLTAQTDISCFGFADGSIEVAGRTLPAFSETLPYTFSWSGSGLGTPRDTNNTSRVDSLAAGTYTLEMEDASGCSVSDSFTITEPALLTVAEDSTRDETCTVGMDGFASVSVNGGTAPYNYLWDDMAMQTDSFAVNLVADTFQVMVTDVNGCMDSLEVLISAPLGPQITSFPSDSVDCNGDTNGALAVTAINGNGNIINYAWSTGNSGANATSIINLSPGKYEVSITADDGCITVDSAFVIDPAPLQLDSIVEMQPTCPGFGNGSLTVFASGGTLPYTYIWDEVPTDDTTTFNLKPGLPAGSYEVTIIDANDCPSILVSGTVNDPPAIVVDFTDIVGVDCFEGDCNGEARAVASLSDGSTGGLFDFNWGNGAAADSTAESLVDGLCAGPNVVSVIDGNGCAEVDTVLIPSPDSIALTLTGDDPSCNGDTDGVVSVSASGGTPGFSYSWPNAGGATDSLVSNLAAGTYTLILTDANGCIKEDSIALVEPAPLTLSIDTSLTNDPRCADSMDGVLAVRVNTQDGINPLGMSPYTWGNAIAGPDTAIATGLAAGTYSVTVTDIEGCTDSLSFTLNQPTPIFFSFQQPADPPCFGDATSLVIDTIFGGAGMNLLDYTYSVDNNGLGFPPNQPTSIFAGTRVITVEDFNGCTASDTIVINQPDELTVTFNPEIVEVELGDTLVRLEPIINSMQIDSFVWSPSIYLSADNIENPIVVPFDNQQYNLRVTDVNGCVAQGDVLVELNRTRNVYIPNVFSPNGDGRNDELRVYACKGVRQINFARVFDRWGGLLYDRQNIGIPDCAGGSVLWDGTIKDQDLPAGVYVYVIEVEFIDDVTLVYRGDVAIIR